MKWIRAIREYDILKQEIQALQKTIKNLEMALNAKASTHSAMGKVLKIIDDGINHPNPLNSYAPTLRRKYEDGEFHIRWLDLVAENRRLKWENACLKGKLHGD